MSLDEFFSAYDRVLLKWPADTQAIDVKTVHGTTRINACGPADGPALVLLPGAGATSTVWFANVEALSQHYRVYGVDIMGDVGRSVPGDHPIDSVDELLNWVTAVLDALDLRTAALCGHSYGAMIALAFALRNESRVDALTLLDPNSCFGSMSPRYLLHALPILLRPNENRQRRFVAWETAGLALDSDWLDVLALGAAHFPTAKTIVPKRPKPAAFEGFDVRTTVVLAGKGKVHNAACIESAVHAVLPTARTVVLENATHHGLPMHPAADVNEILLS
ncbi:alpha/beta fold hydrolase [Rhodococcus sp. IEGM 1401]|uniref:alpha/beta fold hydrolase n=1 Tax=unclassified Rhodococcus (in: high G+C Gram-positive bacteria) TaxID=192944 RepID=UPI0022B5028F|nr:MULTISPECIES: alpha/beta fold hydrolase [unclassified Rhodococcus (in: high G+C Gram-positive bacteria)]MCZ4561292.1 alpha/beta fold hydrolase [Rhodococcus sp. IEGM 1401]MDI9921435.1 alpha/beta fold hydrolase [Rhodococcus sp. IEGM 1372]MDI9928089.1 alpha/beta fold hydrolase [Rhodococcus sp. IEGM 1341]MDV8033778.1 alpha/beta fold hydrolase [Rhodococcus sp. IEGM 1414]